MYHDEGAEQHAYIYGKFYCLRWPRYKVYDDISNTPDGNPPELYNSQKKEELTAIVDLFLDEPFFVRWHI
jgi:hypothetical protein|uniref:Uncharacterized protein n=1 Tax=viral metagenome TaxID=1070528 RepID=A0A6C0K4Y8_9ZZZZ